MVQQQIAEDEELDKQIVRSLYAVELRNAGQRRHGQEEQNVHFHTEYPGKHKGSEEGHDKHRHRTPQGFSRANLNIMLSAEFGNDGSKAVSDGEAVVGNAGIKVELLSQQVADQRYDCRGQSEIEQTIALIGIGSLERRERRSEGNKTQCGSTHKIQNHPVQGAAEKVIADHPDKRRDDVGKLSANGLIHARFFLKEGAKVHNTAGIQHKNHIADTQKQSFTHRGAFQTNNTVSWRKGLT